MNSRKSIKCPFNFIFSDIFDSQFCTFDDKTKRIVNDKPVLIRSNPFRFKSLHHPVLRLFRVRFNYQHTELRLVYFVGKDKIAVVGFVERSHDYNDLDRILKTCGLNLFDL